MIFGYPVCRESKESEGLQKHVKNRTIRGVGKEARCEKRENEQRKRTKGVSYKELVNKAEDAINYEIEENIYSN